MRVKGRLRKRERDDRPFVLKTLNETEREEPKWRAPNVLTFHGRWLCRQPCEEKEDTLRGSMKRDRRFFNNVI